MMISSPLFPNGTPRPQGFLIPGPYHESPIEPLTNITTSSIIYKVCVILIEFTDQAHNPSYTQAYYQNLLFSTNNPLSLRHYYLDASYGAVDLVGDVYGWYTSSHTMDYYGTDTGYPNIDDYNTAVYNLAREACNLANGDINYANYDIEPDPYTYGIVDHLIIIHAGAGQESSADPINDPSNLIWSHRWAIQNPYLILDNHYCLTYTMQAESSPMGVFAHEFGHDIGLPDLYDDVYPPQWDGVGDWGLMGSGSWGGTPQGSRPVHPTAWCKIQLGWITVDTIRYEDDLSITTFGLQPAGCCYKLDMLDGSGHSTGEYFLLVNRRRVGNFETSIPGEGLLIWHVDENNPDNGDPTDPLIKLEEADGNNELGIYGGSQGQSGDPFPYGGNNQFTATTNPNSLKNDGSQSGWEVTAISGVASVMTCHVFNSIHEEPPDIEDDGIFTLIHIFLIVSTVGIIYKFKISKHVKGAMVQ